MTVNNKELVAKAAITAANDLASTGKLNAAQADKFIDFVFDETALTPLVRTVRFRNETLNIDKLGVGTRAAMPKAEAIDPGRRRGVTTAQVTLTPVEIMVPLEISDNFKELNLEGDSIVEHILRLYARRLANDMEELSIHGNETGYLAEADVIIPGGNSAKVVPDSFLALYDGYLKLAQGGNVVDSAGGALSSAMWRQALTAMPTKFKRDRKALRWLVPTTVDELWRERVSSRATGMGDLALSGSGNLTPFGIEMVPIPLMDFYPQQVKVTQFSGLGATLTMPFAPIQAGSVVIILESAAGSGIETTPYVEGVDYTVNSTTGVITHTGGGSAIPATTNLRISYRSFPQIMLTTTQNLILGIGRDIRMERDRDIFRSVDQFATTVKVAVEIEELTAVVVVNNISDSI